MRLNITDEPVSRDALLFVIKALKVGVWEYDIDSDCIKCDARWYEILGIDENISPISSLAQFRPHIHPDDVAVATEVDLLKVPQLLADEDTYHVDFRIVRPAGENRWVRSVACLIHDPVTGNRKAIGCITDITEFRAIEFTVLPSAAGQTLNGLYHAQTPRRSVPIATTLTTKERECLMWVSFGKTATESGVILGKSRRTIEFHLSNAIRKRGATNKIHATAIAIRGGII